MSTLNLQDITAVCGVLLLVIFIHLFKAYRLPPGPPSLPFLGKVFELRGGREWLKYTEWGREYGAYDSNILRLFWNFYSTGAQDPLCISVC